MEIRDWMNCNNPIGIKAKGKRIKLNNATVVKAVEAVKGSLWMFTYVTNTKMGWTMGVLNKMILKPTATVYDIFVRASISLPRIVDTSFPKGRSHA